MHTPNPMIKKISLSIIYSAIFYGLCTTAFAINIKNPQSIQQLLDKNVKELNIIGAQLSIKDEKHHKMFLFASGLADKNHKIPMQSNHLMQIGSTTKSYIAVLLLLLEKDSKDKKINYHFSLEDPLSKWFPEYKNWKDVQIKQLLNMTSGIFNYVDLDGWLFPELYKHPHKIWTNEALIQLAYTHKPNTHFKPGTSFEYSNTNYILAGMLIEKLTGKTVEQVMKEKIFDRYPEKFSKSWYQPDSYPGKLLPSMAHGYMLDSKFPTLYQKDITAITLSWAGAAGAIVANAENLTNWISLLFSADFLDKEQQQKLKSLVCVTAPCKPGQPLSTDQKMTGYGLGIGHTIDPVHGELWSHTGATMGYSTIFFYSPKLSMSMALTINQITDAAGEQDNILLLSQKILKLLDK